MATKKKGERNGVVEETAEKNESVDGFCYLLRSFVPRPYCHSFAAVEFYFP